MTSLEKRFRDYYKKLHHVERRFLIIFIIDMTLYSVILLTYLIVSGLFEYNNPNLSFLLFPLFSGLVTFNVRTVLHGVVLLNVHLFPIIKITSIIYTQHFNCNDGGILNECFLVGSLRHVAIVGFCFLTLVQILYSYHLYLLWKKRIWPIVHEYRYSKNEEIKEKYSVYQLQFPLIHAKLSMVGLWINIYLVHVLGFDISLWRHGSYLNHIVTYAHFIMPLNCIFILYAVLMIKGVRDESKHMIYFVLICNVLQAITIFMITKDYCYVNSVFHLCVKFYYLYNVLAYLGIVSIIILGLSSWNTYRCYKNFGKNLGFYIKYEPIPDEFNCRKKLEKRRTYYSNQV